MRALLPLAVCVSSMACGPADGPPSGPPPEVLRPRLTLVDERLFFSRITGGDTQGDHFLISTTNNGVLRLGTENKATELYPGPASVMSASATIAVTFPEDNRDSYEVWDLSRPAEPSRLAIHHTEQPLLPGVSLTPQRGPIRPGVIDVVLSTGGNRSLLEIDLRRPLEPQERALATCDGLLWRSPGLVLCWRFIQGELVVWRRDLVGASMVASLIVPPDDFLDAALGLDRAVLLRTNGTLATLVVTGTTARLLEGRGTLDGWAFLGLFGSVLVTTGPGSSLLRWDVGPDGGLAPTPRPLSIGAPAEDFGSATPLLLGQRGDLVYVAVNGTISAFDPAGTATVATPSWTAYAGTITGLRQTPTGILTMTDRGLLSQSEAGLLRDPGAAPPTLGSVEVPGSYVVDEGRGGVYVQGGDVLNELRPLTLEGVIGEQRFLITRPSGWESPALASTTRVCRAFVTWYRPKKKRAAISRINLCPGGPLNQEFRETTLPGRVTLYDHGASITVLEGAAGEQASLLDALSGEVLDSYDFGGVTSAAADPKAWVLGVGPEMIHVRPTDGAPRSLYFPGSEQLQVLALGWPHIYAAASTDGSELWVINGESGAVEERIAGKHAIQDVVVGQRGVFVTTDARLRSFEWRTP